MKKTVYRYFCSFFSHYEARKSEHKSLFGGVLSVVLALIIIAFSLGFGRYVSFHYFLKRAKGLDDFVASVLASEEMGITLTNGKLSANTTVNSFAVAEDARYVSNGFNLILDSRDTTQLYDDFRMICKSSNGAFSNISYQTYLTLPQEQRNQYTYFLIEYSGKVLNTKENYETYRAYLEQVTDPNSQKFDQKVKDTLDEIEKQRETDGYYDQIYALYALTYYPTAGNALKDSPVPTISDYYTSLMSRDKNGKYLVLLNDVCYVAYTSQGVPDILLGDYSKVSAKEISGEAFVESVFLSKLPLYYYIPFLRLFDFFPILIVLISVGILSYILLKVTEKHHPKYKRTYASCIQIITSFCIMSGLITAFVALLFSYLVSQAVLFALAFSVFILTLTVRSLIFILLETKDDSYFTVDS